MTPILRDPSGDRDQYLQHSTNTLEIERGLEEYGSCLSVSDSTSRSDVFWFAWEHPPAGREKRPWIFHCAWVVARRDGPQKPDINLPVTNILRVHGVLQARCKSYSNSQRVRTYRAFQGQGPLSLVIVLKSYAPNLYIHRGSAATQQADSASPGASYCEGIGV